MEAKELELIEKYRKDNYQIDRLYREHVDLKGQVIVLENHKGLSPVEEKKLHNLKKEKLEGKEKLVKLLNGLAS